jgi:GNAT superfamily N-acetyltransferase
MIVEYPLTKSNRLQLARAFRKVPRVDVSIECVTEGQMGKCFVDDLVEPTAFEIRLGPFHYFAGNATGIGGQEMLKSLKPYNLLMPSEDGWMIAGRTMYGERLVSFDRYSFSSEKLSPQLLQELCRYTRDVPEVKRMASVLVAQFQGQEHFIDVSNFDSPTDFMERGIGYYMEDRGEVIGAAYSSLVCSDAIEVSVYVLEAYRRKGIATTLAAHLILWCLQNNMDAHWDAANPESCKLALKLGYVPKGDYRAHYLIP